jgi:hypothetical protein
MIAQAAGGVGDAEERHSEGVHHAWRHRTLENISKYVKNNLKIEKKLSCLMTWHNLPVTQNNGF